MRTRGTSPWPRLVAGAVVAGAGLARGARLTRAGYASPYTSRGHDTTYILRPLEVRARGLPLQTS